MRILVVNSNRSEYVTEKCAAAARDVASPGTEIVSATGTFGGKIIGTRTELAIAEHMTIDLLAEHSNDVDAVVIAVSYDVALRASREMLNIPVVGITEAAMLTACMLGGQIGVVVFGQRVLPLYKELIKSYGLQDRVAGYRCVESNAAYSAGDQSEIDALTVAAGRELIEQDYAEVIVLTGAVMAGVPARLQPSIDVPVLDGVSCAVRQAEVLVNTKAIKPKVGSYSKLPARELAGVNPAIAKKFGA